MTEQPNYYSIIPANIRYNKNLKPNEKLLYGEITALCDKNGYCWATNNYFAELYEVHKNTIGTWINHLKELGYIDVVIIYKDRTKEIDKRIIKINTTRDKHPINEIIDTYQSKDCYPINEKIDTPINEIIEGNNTSNEYYKNNKKEKNIKKEKETFLNEIKDSEFKNILLDWLEYKEEIKDTYKSEKSLKVCYENLLKLSNNNPEEAREIVNQSIANQWKGLFKLQNRNSNETNSNTNSNTKTKQLTDLEKEEFFNKNKSNFEKIIKNSSSLAYEDLSLLKKLANDYWVNKFQRTKAESFLQQAESRILNDNQLSAIKILLIGYKTGDWK